MLLINTANFKIVKIAYIYARLYIFYNSHMNEIRMKFNGLTEIRGSHDETSAGRPQGRKYQTLTRFSRRIDLRNTLQANFLQETVTVRHSFTYGRHDSFSYAVPPISS